MLRQRQSKTPAFQVPLHEIKEYTRVTSTALALAIAMLKSVTGKDATQFLRGTGWKSSKKKATTQLHVEFDFHWEHNPKHLVTVTLVFGYELNNQPWLMCVYVLLNNTYVATSTRFAENADPSKVEFGVVPHGTNYDTAIRLLRGE